MNYKLLIQRKHRYTTLLARALASQNDLAIRSAALKIAKLNRMIQQETGVDPQILQGRIDHVKRLIEHCVSVIAICRVGRHPGAEAAYEAQLVRLNAELADLQNREPK
jgi:hypothetical protein